VTRSFASTRRVLCAGLLCAAALYFAPPAQSQSCDNPGNAGVDQYCDPLDPPPGVHRNVPGSSDRIPEATRRALEHGSVSAQGALALSRIKGAADPVGTPPSGRPATPGAPSVPAAPAASDSGPTVGGGFIAVMVAAAVALAVLAFVARRRRSAP
jgi:hypothetical protein